MSHSRTNNVRVAGALCALVLSGCTSIRSPRPECGGPAGDAPYCRSPYIESLTFDWTNGYTEADGSDLWPVTWGADGNVYAFFGDGGGFGGDNRRGRVSFGVAKMTAPPPLSPATAKNVYGGFQA